MIKTTVKIDGMGCPMCEAHICETIRNTFPDAKKVSASHKKGEAEFLTATEPDEEALREAIEKTGYSFVSVSCETEDKKSGFRLFGKK